MHEVACGLQGDKSAHAALDINRSDNQFPVVKSVRTAAASAASGRLLQDTHVVEAATWAEGTGLMWEVSMNYLPIDFARFALKTTAMQDMGFSSDSDSAERTKSPDRAVSGQFAVDDWLTGEITFSAADDRNAPNDTSGNALESTAMKETCTAMKETCTATNQADHKSPDLVVSTSTKSPQPTAMDMKVADLPAISRTRLEEATTICQQSNDPRLKPKHTCARGTTKLCTEPRSQPSPHAGRREDEVPSRAATQQDTKFCQPSADSDQHTKIDEPAATLASSCRQCNDPRLKIKHTCARGKQYSRASPSASTNTATNLCTESRSQQSPHTGHREDEVPSHDVATPPAGFVPYGELRRRPTVGTQIVLLFDSGLGWVDGVVTAVQSPTFSQKYSSRPCAPRLTLEFEDGTVEVLA
eukprot:SAG31_NODE_7224_length_1750_cov_1.585100_1_plen_414_part_00